MTKTTVIEHRGWFPGDSSTYEIRDDEGHSGSGDTKANAQEALEYAQKHDLSTVGSSVFGPDFFGPANKR